MSTAQQTVHQSLRGLNSAVAKVRDGLSARRTARQSHRRLERELATYTSPWEINDLFSLLTRYDDEDAEQIRAILRRRLAA